MRRMCAVVDAVTSGVMTASERSFVRAVMSTVEARLESFGLLEHASAAPPIDGGEVGHAGHGRAGD